MTDDSVGRIVVQERESRVYRGYYTVEFHRAGFRFRMMGHEREWTDLHDRERARERALSAGIEVARAFGLPLFFKPLTGGEEAVALE